MKGPVSGRGTLPRAAFTLGRWHDTFGMSVLPGGRDGLEMRSLALEELSRATEIDVTEDGTTILEQRGAVLSVRPDTWSRRSRSAEGWAEFERHWRAFIPEDGMALGAFEGGRLVGIATLRRGIRPRMDQLEALFVDRAHRRQGIASRLIDGIEAAAREGGAHHLYVSATPSESAVGCYLSHGFVPTDEPVPELLELEPEDVHMVLDLGLKPVT
jgi:GNAT superfamily N-acetyltransferase